MAKLKEIFKIATLGMLAIIFSMIFLIGVSHANSYNIATCTELQNIQNDVAGTYTLGNDIDCSDTINWNGGAGFLPIENFTGTLDGSGFIIRDFFINRPTELNQGLFGFDFGNPNLAVIIQDLGMEDINITCNVYCGAIAGWNAGYLLNSYATGTITGAFTAHVGGLVGINQGVINNSWANISICAYTYKAGLISDNYGILQDSYTIGNYGEIGTCDNGLSESGLCAANGGGSSTLGHSYYASDLEHNAIRDYCGGTTYRSNSTEMQKKSTFVDWDFINTWDICTRSNPHSYPILRSFGACCIGSWSCTKYTACGNYHQNCLIVHDNNCGYTYDPALDGNLTQWGRNCTINAQAEDVGLQGFDLRYESNVLLLLVMIVAYIGIMAIGFAFRNPGFGFLGFLIGVGIGLIFMQVSPFLTLGFIFLNILVFYNTSRGR